MRFCRVPCGSGRKRCAVRFQVNDSAPVGFPARKSVVLGRLSRDWPPTRLTSSSLPGRCVCPVTWRVHTGATHRGLFSGRALLGGLQVPLPAQQPTGLRALLGATRVTMHEAARRIAARATCNSNKKQMNLCVQKQQSNMCLKKQAYICVV
eukprot:362622-Chlamydomonas_euryale.AAC.5